MGCEAAICRTPLGARIIAGKHSLKEPQYAWRLCQCSAGGQGARVRRAQYSPNGGHNRRRRLRAWSLSGSRTWAVRASVEIYPRGANGEVVKAALGRPAFLKAALVSTLRLRLRLPALQPGGCAALSARTSASGS